jgi:hypothetical protein
MFLTSNVMKAPGIGSWGRGNTLGVHSETTTRDTKSRAEPSRLQSFFATA